MLGYLNLGVNREFRFNWTYRAVVGARGGVSVMTREREGDSREEKEGDDKREGDCREGGG